jgi:hypothetical protein
MSWLGNSPLTPVGPNRQTPGRRSSRVRSSHLPDKHTATLACALRSGSAASSATLTRSSRAMEGSSSSPYVGCGISTPTDGASLFHLKRGTIRADPVPGRQLVRHPRGVRRARRRLSLNAPAGTGSGFQPSMARACPVSGGMLRPAMGSGLQPRSRTGKAVPRSRWRIS